MFKVTEAHIQAVLMRWVMEVKHHDSFIPNSNQFFTWEADLLSVTSSGLIHEFEIKTSIQDYRRDAKKRKHYKMDVSLYSPAYFWYVTFGFEIEPPENAGWIFIEYKKSDNGKDDGWNLNVKKEAPRRNEMKIDENKRRQLNRLLSWRLYHVYARQYLIERNAEKVLQ